MSQTTRSQVALEAGVSESTVSRALSDSSLIPDKTKQKVILAAKKLGYYPNASASRLASKKSFMIGFVTPDFTEHKGALEISYYSHILNSCVKTCKTFGYGVSVFTITQNKDGIKEIILNHERKTVDGFFLLGLEVTSELPKKMNKQNIPYVLLGFNSSSNDSSIINFSFKHAIKSLIEYLEKSQYKHLIYVEGNQNYFDAINQKNTLREQIKDSSIKMIEIFRGDYSRKSGYELGSKILNSIKPDSAIFFANDQMASGFYKFAFENKLRIPEDVAVIGADDEDFTRIITPPLASIKQPRKEIGILMAKNLIAKLHNEYETEKVEEECLFKPRDSIRRLK